MQPGRSANGPGAGNPGPFAPPPDLIDPSIVLVSRQLDGADIADCHPVERAGLSKTALPIRQREFAAGRACTADALGRLGIPGGFVAVAPDRSPMWPQGIVGSISHSRTYAAAAVARRSDGLRAIGLDIEEATPLAGDLVAEVCVTAERLWLATQPAHRQGQFAKAIFCAKEAAYKCQYPLSRCLFGFDALQIELSADLSRFTALFLADARPFAAGDIIEGRLWMADGHYVALSTLR